MSIPSDLGPIPPYASNILGTPKSTFTPFVPSGSFGIKISPQEFFNNIEEMKGREVNITPFHKFDLRLGACANKEETTLRFLSLLGDKLGLQLDEQTSLSEIYEAVVKGVTENQDLAFTAILRHWLTKSIST